MKSALSISGKVLIALAALSCSVAAFAQSASRGGNWDVSFNVLYADSKTLNSSNGSSAEVDNGYGWGFGIGYNFNNHFGLEFNGSWRDADYTATTTPQAGNPNGARKFSGSIDVGTLAVNATYNILPGALTPFVTGGIGGTYVNTDIPAGLPVNVCWWDPWWGYYCGPVVPTKSDEYFTYNAGVGVRWDSPQGLFLRGMVSEQWLDVGGGIGTASFTQFRFDIGTRF